MTIDYGRLEEGRWPVRANRQNNSPWFVRNFGTLRHILPYLSGLSNLAPLIPAWYYGNKQQPITKYFSGRKHRPDKRGKKRKRVSKERSRKRPRRVGASSNSRPPPNSRSVPPVPRGKKTMGKIKKSKSAKRQRKKKPKRKGPSATSLVKRIVAKMLTASQTKCQWDQLDQYRTRFVEENAADLFALEFAAKTRLVALFKNYEYLRKGTALDDNLVSVQGIDLQAAEVAGTKTRSVIQVVRGYVKYKVRNTGLTEIIVESWHLRAKKDSARTPDNLVAAGMDEAYLDDSQSNELKPTIPLKQAKLWRAFWTIQKQSVTKLGPGETHHGIMWIKPFSVSYEQLNLSDSYIRGKTTALMFRTYGLLGKAEAATVDVSSGGTQEAVATYQFVERFKYRFANQSMVPKNVFTNAETVTSLESAEPDAEMLDDTEQTAM